MTSCINAKELDPARNGSETCSPNCSIQKPVDAGSRLLTTEKDHSRGSVATSRTSVAWESRLWDRCPSKSARSNLATIRAQALWTMTRESLNITTVVFANRDYAVLKREFSSLGVSSPGPRAARMRLAARILVGRSWRTERECPASGLLRWMHSGRRYGRDWKVRDRR
jgi:hypothetical protein